MSYCIHCNPASCSCEGECLQQRGGHDHLSSLKKSTLKNSWQMDNRWFGSGFSVLCSHWHLAQPLVLPFSCPFPLPYNDTRPPRSGWVQVTPCGLYAHSPEQAWSTWRAQRRVIHHPSSNLSWATQCAQSLVAWQGTGGHLLLACTWSVWCRLGCAASSTWGWCGGACLLLSRCCLPKALLKCFAFPRAIWERKPPPEHLCKVLKHAFSLVGKSSSQAELVGENLKWLKLLALWRWKKSLLPFCCTPPSTVLARSLRRGEAVQGGGSLPLFVARAVLYYCGFFRWWGVLFWFF